MISNMFYENQFQRLELMLGREKMERLQNGFVVIVGLGAVGSYVTEALARAGIRKLRLVDHDVVKPSNINRQLFATWDTVGQMKCEVAAARVRSIFPDCRIEILNLFVHEETVLRVLYDFEAQKPDFVVDAIDSLNPKIALIRAVLDAGIPLISSMGAALRTDPSLVQIGPLSEATYCPLAAILRKHLRRRQIPITFDCVYSSEPVRELHREAVLPPEESEDNFQGKGRQRSSLGSLPTLTGIFGLTAANHVLMQLLKRP